MKVECPKCHRKYQVEDAYIPIGGAPIRCPNCSNIFGIYVEPIEIPMSPIEEDIPQQVSAPVQEPEPQMQTPPPVSETYQPAPEPAPQAAPVIDHSFDMPADETQPNAELGALGNLGQTVNNNDTADELSSMMNNASGETNAFDTPQQAPSEAPDLGAFGSPAQETPSQPEPSPFDIPQQAPSEAPDLGAFGAPAQETPSQPEPSPFDIPQQAPSEAPDLGAFGAPAQETPSQPEPSPFDIPQQAEPEPVQSPIETFQAPEPQSEPIAEEKPAPADAKKKLGGALFESLLAGFTLPDNFKNMPDNIQKNHKNSIKLARQLAKDILLYHKEEVERGLANANIKDVLKDEIEKSYKFYSQRVQPEILDNSNYFNEALNKIIAKGDKIF